MSDFEQIFSWISGHIHLAGWMAIMSLVWKASKFFNKATSAAEKIDKVDTTVNSLATNHLPHMEEHMKENNEILRGIRQDIFTVLLSKIHHE